MTRPFRIRLRQLIRRSGYDLLQKLPTLSDLLVARRVDVVLDVGANTGQFGTLLRQWGYRGRIVPFEPLPAAFATLAARAATDPMWTAEPYALGASETEADLNVSSMSVFSSLRTPLAAVHAFDARSATVAVESVSVRRLDAVFETFVKPGVVSSSRSTRRATRPTCSTAPRVCSRASTACSSSSRRARSTPARRSPTR